MRRRAPGELIAPFRRREHGPEGEKLRDELAAWAMQVESSLTGHWPKMPSSIADRDADVWEALLSVAEAAGGDWPERARVSAVSLVSLSKAGTPSLGVKLLADMQKLFGDQDNLSTESILSDLHRLDESPWGDIRGKPLDARGLAQRLGKYDIKPTQVRIGATTLKGYRRVDLYDAWVRYLGTSHNRSETSETSDMDGDSAVAAHDHDVLWPDEHDEVAD